MSYTIHLSLQVAIRADVPSWLGDYLRGISGPRRREVVVRAPADVDPMWTALPDGVWFDGVPCALDESAHVFRLSGAFHDEFGGNEAPLLAALASVADGDQVIGATWTDMEPARATVHAVRGGELFAAESGPWRWFGPLTADRTGPPPAPPVEFLRDGGPDAQRAAIARHGGGPAALTHHDAVAGPAEPTYARHLLARSIARVLARHGATAALGPVLGVLDDGHDPLAAPTSPGWVVGETWEAHRGRAATTRVVSGGLAAAGDALVDADLDAAPIRFTTGDVLRTRQALQLRTMGTGRRERVDVAAGEPLVVGHVHDRGHAQVTRAGDETALGFVTPESVGELYDIAAYAPIPTVCPSPYDAPPTA